MKIRNVLKSKTLALGTLLAVGSAAAPAFAQTTGSLSGLSALFSGLDTADIVTAIVSAGVILVGVGFAKWGTKKVGKFFG
ncbi:MAG: hypothetical protein WA777_10765 [Rhodanobacter sp.]